MNAYTTLVIPLALTVVLTLVTWSPSPSDDVTGYHVYYTPPGGSEWIFKKATPALGVRVKVPARYYLQGGRVGVTAIDAAGNESTVAGLTLEQHMLEASDEDNDQGVAPLPLYRSDHPVRIADRDGREIHNTELLDP